MWLMDACSKAWPLPWSTDSSPFLRDEEELSQQGLRKSNSSPLGMASTWPLSTTLMDHWRTHSHIRIRETRNISECRPVPGSVQSPKPFIEGPIVREPDSRRRGHGPPLSPGAPTILLVDSGFTANAYSTIYSTIKARLTLWLRSEAPAVGVPKPVT